MGGIPERGRLARRNGRELAICSLIFLAAVAPRALPQWNAVIEAGHGIIRDPDACYHLRRAALMVENFPSLAIFDSYLNYPKGDRVIWPPLYDLSLAASLKIFPSAQAWAPSLPVTLIPVLLAGLTAIALYRLARRLWPRRRDLPLLAAALPTLIPADYPYTKIGQLDHHAAEILWVVLLTGAIGSALQRSRDRGGPIRAALLPALILAGAVLTQAGLLVLVLIPIGAQLILLRSGCQNQNPLRLNSAIFGLAGLLLLPWSIAYHRAGAVPRPNQFGLLQAALLLAAALAGGGLLLIRSKQPRWLRIAGAAAVGLGFAWLAARLLPQALENLSFLAGSRSVWVQRIGESRSLLRMPLADGLAELVGAFSILILLAPLGLVLLLRRARSGDQLRAALAAAALLMTALAIVQARFFPHLAALLGILTASAAEPLEPHRRWRAWIAPALALLALLTTWSRRGRPEVAEIAFDRSRSVLQYLRHDTPATSFYSRPLQPPEYGVLAEWSYGHYIQFHGRRPALADNFGTDTGTLRQVLELFLETDEERALQRLRRLRVRYVLVADLASTFAGLIPEAAEVHRFVLGFRRTGPGAATLRFKPAISATLLYRLAWQNGAGVFDDTVGVVAPLAAFRLIAESPAREPLDHGRSIPWVKLYELVASARLRAVGLRAGQEGLLVAQVRMPGGSVFPYVALLRANARGTAQLKLPYPTVASGSSWIERYELDFEGVPYAIPPLSETAIRRGGWFRLRPRPSVAGPVAD